MDAPLTWEYGTDGGWDGLRQVVDRPFGPKVTYFGYRQTPAMAATDHRLTRPGRQSSRRPRRARPHHPPEDDNHGLVAHNFASSACSVCIPFSQSGPSAQDA